MVRAAGGSGEVSCCYDNGHRSNKHQNQEVRTGPCQGGPRPSLWPSEGSKVPGVGVKSLMVGGPSLPGGFHGDLLSRLLIVRVWFRMDRQTWCVNLAVQPSRALVDERFSVLLHNCPPGLQVTLHAVHHSDDGHSYEAFAHYVASASGSVNGGSVWVGGRRVSGGADVERGTFVSLQSQRTPVWAGLTLGSNQWVSCGASGRFRAASRV